MTLKRLRLRNLLFHWRGNLAVFLGVVVGTAVLTGALLVGDSLRGSLRERTLQQLGWVEEALIAPRFFRQALAGDVAMSGAAERVCPVIMLQGMIVVRAKGGEGAIRRQIRGVTVLGVESSFWSAFGEGTEPSEEKRVVLNSVLGNRLDASPGDSVSLRLQKPSAIPRETLLGRRDDKSVIDDWTLTVGQVLGTKDAADAFHLRPDLEAPLTAFVPLGALQERLGLAGRCNALLAGGVHASLDMPLRSHLRLDDWGLVLHGPNERVEALFRRLDKNQDGKLQPREWRDRLATSVVEAIHPGRNPTLAREEVESFYRKNRNYLSLKSKQLLLEPFLTDTALEAAKESRLRAAPTLVYLVNTIAAYRGAGIETFFHGVDDIPYSVVAAIDPTQPPPLGPFLPPGVERLADFQIVLADWKDLPLPHISGSDPKRKQRKIEIGDMVTLLFFPPTHQGGRPEEFAFFHLAGFIPLEGVADDPDLTPEFPGITDKLNITDWDPPFPYDSKRIKQRDEDYWRRYRTTPKAYVNLSVGQRLWGSRFGRLTSVRMAPEKGDDLSQAAATFKKHLLARLDPAQGGLVFNPVREQALEASKGGGMDFSWLFLGFSFFLIAASLLLVGLLFRLNIDRRAEEIGVLLAVGYRQAAVRRLLLSEGAVLAAAGAVVGSCLAMLYARLLLQLLAALWPGEALQSFLRPHFEPLSLAGGAGASFLVSVLTVAWAVFSLGRVAPSALLAGQMAGETEKLGRRRRRGSWWIAGASLAGGLALLAGSGRVKDHEMRAMTFFGSGSLLLIACLAALSGWMRSSSSRTVEGHGLWSVARLGIRNAARHPGRSLLTAGLLAAAAFLLVAVEAFRRRVDAHEAVAQANGGYNLVAESDLPLFRDLNTKEGRQEAQDKLLPIYRDEFGGDNSRAERRAKEAAALLEQVKVVAFRVHAGDDVSCLNLYQPLRPRLLGVPVGFIESQHGDFRFAATLYIHSRGPWWLLLEPQKDFVPAFGEKNTVEWMLKTGLEGEVKLPPDHRLRIDGLLSDSVFQSSLLVSEANFLRMYPGHEGYNFFLIRAPQGKETEVRRVLELAYGDRGLQVTPTAERLNAYLDVENMYLSTFQALGGLGLLLGSLGLAVVLLRGVWERRGELALLRALGFRRSTLGWLVLAENAFLLLVGLLAGTASALLSVSPHLLGGGGSIPWMHLLGLLAGVVLVGLIAGALATASTLRAPLILALRRE
ncbi:MAG TPA: ABC transporter permease [Gemmataceae bacterium]|nr:ABC transporter permease [Gemmataceae bacterium]